MSFAVNLNFQKWVLISIIAYAGLIVLVVIIRHCIIKRKFCVLPQCCQCCSFCKVPKCKWRYCETTKFCCSKSDNSNEINWLMGLPSCKTKCFSPDCSYCRCICCEIVCESGRKTNKVEDSELYFTE